MTDRHPPVTIRPLLACLGPAVCYSACALEPPVATSEVQEAIEQLRERYAAFGQGHVFRFWDSLGEAARTQLADQARRIDLAALRRIQEHTRQLAAPGTRKLAPAAIEQLPSRGGSVERRAAAAKRGEELLRAGRVGVMVVAGGQGTRLGFEGPKGIFPLGPVSGRTLFQLHAEKLRGARRRHRTAIPWYVMTSPATDAATRSFFERHASFGIPREDVVFLCQSMAPALDFEGRLILEAPDRIAESPNGHGGAFQALADSGALDDMDRRGISTISYFQVDNPMIRLADPLFVGLHGLEQAEMSCKVVRKLDPLEKVGVVARVDGRTSIVEYTEIDEAHRDARDAAGELLYWAGSIAIHAIDGSEMSAKVVRKIDPMEKVGVLARVDGRVGVVEYTEIDDASRHARDPRGDLVYWAGSIAIHALEVSFARRIAAEAERFLPYHASAKKIPFVDDHGAPVKPSEPNGHKLERFLFDALPAARRVTLLEVERGDEYAPLKNAEGSDSPATARCALDALVRRWLAAASIEVAADRWVEVDHARLDGADDVSHVRSAEDAGLVLAPRT